MLELAVLHDIYKCLGWWFLTHVTSEHFPTSVEIDRCKNKHGTKLGTPGRTDLVLVPIHHQVLGVIVFRFVQSGIYPKKAPSMQKNVDHPFFSVSRRLSWKVLCQKCLSIQASVSKSCFVSKIVCAKASVCKPAVCVPIRSPMGVPCFPPGADFGSQLPVTRDCGMPTLMANILCLIINDGYIIIVYSGVVHDDYPHFTKRGKWKPPN